MTLRNAFEGMATEGTLRRLLHALTFAKDINDRLIVNINSGTISGLNQINWAANNAQATWYSTGAPTSMDAREQQRQLARRNVLQARHSRWTIT